MPITQDQINRKLKGKITAEEVQQLRTDPDLNEKFNQISKKIIHASTLAMPKSKMLTNFYFAELLKLFPGVAERRLKEEKAKQAAEYYKSFEESRK